MKISSLIANAGLNYQKYNGAVNPPVYHLSSIIFPTIQEYQEAKRGGNNRYYSYKGRDCSYGSSGSLTASELAQSLALLETNSTSKLETLIYPSGLAALTLTVTTLCSKGSHILVPYNAYMPFRRFVSNDLTKMGVEVTFYDPKQKIDNLIKKNTSVLMMESPSSIIFEITDIEQLVQIAQANNIITIMDNTWATPLFFKPIEHGIDISICAVTKYINGHSDVLMGVTHSQGDIFKRLYVAYRNSGIAANSQDCYLVQRGMRTLYLRLFYQQGQALKIAQFLETVPEVEHVLYPALPSSLEYDLWRKYYKGATALFSIILNKNYPEDVLAYMINNMELFKIGASWGGYNSLIMIFDLDAYHTIFNKYQGSCIRIYCGLEDADDLIADLENAFVRLRQKSDFISSSNKPVTKLKESC